MSFQAFSTTASAFFVLMALLGPYEASSKPRWEFNDEEGGITLYIRDVEGSDVNEIKVVGIVSCTTDEVWDLLMNEETFLQIMPDVTVSKNFESCGETCTFNYQRFELPGVDDRHLILRARWSITQKDDINQYTEKWEVANDRKPEPEEGVVVVEVCSGMWKLRSVESGSKTKVVYQNHVEVGGNIPDFVVNEATEDNAMTFIKNLQSWCTDKDR